MASFANAPPVSGSPAKPSAASPAVMRMSSRAALLPRLRQRPDRQEQPTLGQHVVDGIEAHQRPRHVLPMASPAPSMAAICPSWLTLE